jgi:putative phosphoesterase
MKIGILSDTHLHDGHAAAVLADKLLCGPFSAVDAILHAGDIVWPDLGLCFAPIPWYGVCGNMDTPSASLPLQRIVTLNNVRIGMVHGWGAPAGIEQRVLDHFSDKKIDVLVFGHSHRPVCRWAGSVFLLNPGSATDRRSAPCHTVGILDTDGEISGEIISID